MFYIYLTNSSIVQYLEEKQVHFGLTLEKQIKKQK